MLGLHPLSMGTISSITEKKMNRNLCILANEVNSIEGDIMGPTAHVQINCRLKDKNAGHLKSSFSGT